MIDTYVLSTYALSAFTLLGYATYMRWHYSKQCKNDDQ